MLGTALVRRYRPFIGTLLRALRYIGTRVTCPCCGWHFRGFLPFGVVVKRTHALCPRCGSLERHRLLWLYLKNRTDLFDRNHRVLHFAPERIFAKVFRTMPLLHYVSADLSSKRARLKTDIMDIPCKDNSFDVVLCNHVLEHVADDQKAMRELCRVLSPGGWAILQTPIDTQRAKTFEDPTITSPSERERAFGQHNHVRLYGRDYKERLEKAGFTVKVDGYAGGLEKRELVKYGLPDEEIYFCRKPLLSNAGNGSVSSLPS
ncbi:MAG: methyltransferase domain-containing protein [Deltaproteobacteria bacterium]|nr:methyltransferase domain-containing protein [Deltaproteobacteria bacterium]